MFFISLKVLHGDKKTETMKDGRDLLARPTDSERSVTFAREQRLISDGRQHLERESVRYQGASHLAGDRVVIGS